MTDRRSQSGFSLIELLVVIVILGVLAGIAVPRLLERRQDAANAAAVSDLRNLIAVQYGLEAQGVGYSEDAVLLAAEGWEASPNVRVCAEVLPPDDLALTSWSVQGDLVYTWQRSVAGISSNEIVLPSDCTGAGQPVS